MRIAERATVTARTVSPKMQDEEDLAATFSAFCRVQYRSLLAVITVVTRDPWVAEDIAQEALARNWIHWSRVSTLEEPAGWTRHAALNLARSYLRRRRVADLARRSGRQVSPDSSNDGLDAALMSALDRLTPRQRAAIAWRYLADLPVSDVASIMRCKEGTVKALTSQGMARLRQAMMHSVEGNREE